MEDITKLYNDIRQTAYKIHEYLGNGHLEKVYENALANRLSKRGLTVEVQHPIKEDDEDSTLIGEYFADLWVEKMLLIELKAARTLAAEHEAQILGYLKATKTEHGLLINFGAYRFYARKYRWKHAQSEPC
jgi:GxxExxY protein